MLTQRLGIHMGWISFWIDGKKSIRTNTGRISTKNRFFSPFVLSFDKIMGKQGQVVLAILSQIMAVKMDELVSCVTGWVNGWFVIAVTRSFLRGNMWSLIYKSIAYLGTRLGIRLGMGFGPVVISCQNCIAHTYTYSPIQVHPYL